MKKLFINSGLVFLSLSTSFLLLEGILHMLPLKYKYIYPLEPGGYLQFDSEIGFDITPNFATSTHAFYDLKYPVWSNSLGCFDYEYDGESSYIYIAGDSFTWGFTPLSDKWTKYIEKSAGIRTVTCGVNAFGTRQQVIKAERVISKIGKKPEIILVGYFTNDFADDYNFPEYTSYKGYRVPYPAKLSCSREEIADKAPISTSTDCVVPRPEYSFLQKVKFEIALRSVIYMMAQKHGVLEKIKGLLRDVFDNNKSEFFANEWPRAEENIDLAWKINKTSILAFKELALKNDSKLVFVLIPDVSSARNPSFLKDEESPLFRVKSILEEENIDYIDLWPDFYSKEKLPELPLYWDFDSHWNVYGNHLAGLLVTKSLIEKGFIVSLDQALLLSEIKSELEKTFTRRNSVGLDR